MLILSTVTMIVAIFLYFALGEAQRWPAIVSVFVVSLLIYAFGGGKKAPSSSEFNVWLDGEGLHWLGGNGEEQLLPRDAVVGFWIGDSTSTHRSVASLVLILRNDFISQPLEIHDPVTPAAVRAWLLSAWQITEVSTLPARRRWNFPIEPEFDEEWLLWRFRGSRGELVRMLDTWLDISSTSLPARGAQPREFQIDFGEITPGMIVILSRQTWVNLDTISLPPEKLATLANALRDAFGESAAEATATLVTENGESWRFRLEDLGS